MEQELNQVFKKANPETGLTQTQELYSYINHLTDANIASLLKDYQINPSEIKYYARLGNFTKEQINEIKEELGEPEFKELLTDSPATLYQKLVEREKKEIRGENQ